ncbi:hypothetical protein [Paenibacillus xylanivorans]|uniref:hypothetical protein n=1 Tax=Paenibacillus xylanivorans TaxID=1705561 RepID=UPI000B0A16B4|nr:hypothetical protein [Paenibacillus xylanivorans]
MKWYHKAIYSFANSVLPAAVKRQMMGFGRMTSPRSSNGWDIFNWLPKKYQSAHNIDLTKLQNHTAEELLAILVSVHPDISHALYNFLRMGDTPLTFTAKKQNGSDDKNGQRSLDAIKNLLDSPLPSSGYQLGRSLDKLDTIQRIIIMVRGACAGEVVLNEHCNDVVDIMLLTLRRFGSGEKRVRINLFLGNTSKIHVLLLVRNVLLNG